MIGPMRPHRPDRRSSASACARQQDYVTLVNVKGGVEGFKIKSSRSTTSTRCRRRWKPMSGTRSKAQYSKALRHAADAGAEQEADRGQDSGTSPGFGTSAAADGSRFPISSRSRRPTGRKAPRRSVRQGQAGRGPEGQEDRLSVLRQPGGARSRCRSSRICRRSRASSCALSRCRRRAWRWAHRCSTSPQRFQPDFVIAHLFGRSPSVAIKESSVPAFRSPRWSASSGPLPRRISKRPAAGGGRRLPYDPIRRRRRRLPGAQGDRGACTRRRVRQPPKEMDVDRVLQPRPADGRSSCRGDP